MAAAPAPARSPPNTSAIVWNRSPAHWPERIIREFDAAMIPGAQRRRAARLGNVRRDAVARTLALERRTHGQTAGKHDSARVDVRAGDRDPASPRTASGALYNRPSHQHPRARLQLPGARRTASRSEVQDLRALAVATSRIGHQEAVLRLQIAVEMCWRYVAPPPASSPSCRPAAANPQPSNDRTRKPPIERLTVRNSSR